MAVAVLAAGAAFRWTQALVAVCAAIALGAQLPSRRSFARRSPLLVGLCIAAGLTALSLIPLPAAIRSILDPVGTGLRDDGAALLDLSPWPSLARDAPAALSSLVFFLALVAVAIVAIRLAGSEAGRYRLLCAVAVLCGLAAVITGIHELFGATKLYGFYEMRARPNVLGPLLNENHLGGLMALGTCVAIGLAMHRRQRTWLRATWFAVVVMCGAVTAASNSRGALVGLGCGAALTAVVLIGQRFVSASPHKARGHFATSSLPIGIVGICVVVLVVYSSAGSVSNKIDRTNSDEINLPRSKFAAWRTAEHLVRESPWVGTGRGGLEPSFTRLHPASGNVTFAYLENEYLQAIVDWGIPGALLLLAALIWFASVAIRRWRDGALTAGALGAVAAIAIQSNVDFGVEFLGLAIPVVVVCATLAYVPMREDDARALRISRGLRGAHVAALGVGAALLFANATKSIAEDHDALRDGSPTLDAIRASLDRHPLDYFGYAEASELFARTNDARSITLLNHAMRLHPTHPDLHRIAARLLKRAGHPEQATVEYAAAIRAAADPDKIVSEVLVTFPPDLAAASIPGDYPVLDAIVGMLRAKHREDVAALWLPRVLTVHPHDVHACNLLYELSLGLGDLKTAEAAGRACVEMMPDHQTRAALAKLMLQKQGYDEVVRLLQDVEQWNGLVEEHAQAWLLLCDARIGLRQWDNATLCLHKLQALGALSETTQLGISRRLDDIRQQRQQQDLGSGSK